VVESVEAEVLDHRPVGWRPNRLAKVVILVLIAAVTVGVFVDRRSRDVELIALDECSALVETSIANALGPVTAMANYVRPTREVATGSLSTELDAMVSEVAAAALPVLGDAATVCDEVQVWSHHLAAAGRKQSCLDRVARAERHLRDISRDGATYFRSSENLLATPSC
jgi:hypothetical protein